MKVHIHKQQASEKTSMWQFIGLARATPCYEVFAWFELDSEERLILDKSPEIYKRVLIPYTYNGMELNVTVELITKHPKKSGEKGWRFVTYSADAHIRMEQEVLEGARILKSNIQSLIDAGTEGSSTYQL